ncbi:MAG TPA: phosphoserine phosphatase SerB [Jiangellaceae bacterium]|jgi:phosphoserine phosphatase|nr:phosphoserine phosphatase SerB [Jiangellaceae bacterium]
MVSALFAVEPDDDATLLLTVTGRDRPGVTSELFAALGRHNVDVLDIEQVVIRGRLVLGVLVTSPAENSGLGEDLRQVAASLDLQIELAPGRSERRTAVHRAHVTVIGHPLRPVPVSAVARRIADTGANIDRIVRLAAYPVTSVELEVSGADPATLRADLAAVAVAQGIDLAVQPAGLSRRAKRLIVMDVDSTLVQGEVIEMLAERAGVLGEVAEVTAAAMRGELDFADSLRRRVRLLAGLPVAALAEVGRNVTLTAGARTLVRTLKRLDYRLAIVSGGFTQITDHIVDDLEIDYAAANTVAVADGRLTGELVEPILDRAGKADAMARFAEQAGVPLAQTVAIGDGANDLDMIARAGLGVAFNAKPLVRDAADTAVSVPYLDTVLYLLGISREDVEAADAADGQPTPSPPVPPSA